MTKKETSVVKGIAILCMIFHHLFYKADKYALYGFTGLIVNESVMIYIAKLCKICVSIFALMTGYGMTKTAKRDHGVFQKTGSMKRYLGLVEDLTYILTIALVCSCVFNTKNTAAIWGEGVNMWVGIFANMLGIAAFTGGKWFNSSWWYCTVAIHAIFLFPILYKGLKLVGPYAALVISVLIIPSLFTEAVSKDTFWKYLPSLTCGMVLAEYDLVEKANEWMKTNWKRYAMGIAASIVILAGTLWLMSYFKLNYFFHAAIAVNVTILTYMIFNRTAGIREVLSLLGRNSKYMWLIHVFVYSHWFGTWIFLLKNVWLIYGVIVAVTLVFSVSLKYSRDIFKNKICKNTL